MRVPLSWLRDFAPIETDPADVAATLSGLGLVVEGMERVGEDLGDVVVARVEATRPHPSADRVQLVDVDDGGGATRQVVCGAFNFGAGDLVPLAPVGARLPGGLEIGRRKVRGEWSEGMLCSGRELALSDDGAGIMVLPAGLEPGARLVDALGLQADVVFEVDVTPNRPDALSMLGVARDLAARLGVPLSVPEPPALAIGEGATVRVESPDLCPRFTATPVVDVVVGPSPGWLANRLTLAGMRPINNVVDVSNYVMLELGHPNHPYDLALLSGGALLVRRGVEGERLSTLDGVERAVGPDDCLICDAEGIPVGIGGIMGGSSTEIGDATRRVLLEVAYFDPLAIARTSKRLALRTEASVRFERGVDPRGLERAAARFCQLLAETAGSRVDGPLVDVSADRPCPPPVRVRTARVNRILGTGLTADQVRGYLDPIGFHCEPVGDGSGDLSVTIPSWRPDSEREIDVIEEVARHHGYTRVERTTPAIAAVGALTPHQRDRRRVRQVLVGAGLSEAWSTSLLAPADLERTGAPLPAVEVENPLAQEESVLRTAIRPGLLRALLENANHRETDVALFEIGAVFLPPAGEGPLPEEPEHMAVAGAGRDAGWAKRVLDTLLDDLAVADVQLEQAEVAGYHPTRTARVSASGVVVGEVGEADPEVLARVGLEGPVGWFELDLGRLLDAPRRPQQYRPVSRFPSADFDLAFVVAAATPAAAVEGALRAAAGDVLESLHLFDVFRGERFGPDRRSLAYRLRVASPDRTLTDDDLAAIRQRCIEAVESGLEATLRG